VYKNASPIVFIGKTFAQKKIAGSLNWQGIMSRSFYYGPFSIIFTAIKQNMNSTAVARIN